MENWPAWMINAKTPWRKSRAAWPRRSRQALGEPGPLAAAGLGGDPTPGQMSRWAAGFRQGGEHGGRDYFAGRFDASPEAGAAGRPGG